MTHLDKVGVSISLSRWHLPHSSCHHSPGQDCRRGDGGFSLTPHRWRCTPPKTATRPTGHPLRTAAVCVTQKDGTHHEWYQTFQRRSVQSLLQFGRNREEFDRSQPSDKNILQLNSGYRACFRGKKTVPYTSLQTLGNSRFPRLKSSSISLTEVLQKSNRSLKKSQTSSKTSSRLLILSNLRERKSKTTKYWTS